VHFGSFAAYVLGAQEREAERLVQMLLHRAFCGGWGLSPSDFINMDLIAHIDSPYAGTGVEPTGLQ
jgi:hypothetical protein